MILSLSMATAIALLPFAIHRFVNRDWEVAALDSFCVGTMFLTFAYVYFTRKTAGPRVFVAIVFLATEIATTYLKGPAQVIWAFPATIGIYFLLDVWTAAIFNMISVMVLTALVGGQIESDLLSSFLISLTSTNVFVLIFAMRNQKQRKQLHELSFTDDLTGIANQRAFDHLLNQIAIAPRRETNELAMISFNIDHLKKINDQFGYVVGDEILVRLAEMLQTQLPKDAKLYRLSKEQYVLAPLPMNGDNALEYAERLRTIVENSTFAVDAKISVSMGVARYRLGEHPRTWLQRTEDALNRAKDLGRNRCVLAP